MNLQFIIGSRRNGSAKIHKVSRPLAETAASQSLFSKGPKSIKAKEIMQSRQRNKKNMIKSFEWKACTEGNG